MSLTSSTDLQQFIASQVASGAFRDQNELLAEAVLTLRMRQAHTEKRRALLNDLGSGIKKLDQGLGEPTSAKQILAELMKN